jgi:predicted esterase
MSGAPPAGELDHIHVFEAGTSGWTLLLLHGTGGDERDLLALGGRLAPDAALLSPRGKVLEAGMPRFFRRIAVGQLDIPDLLVRTDELADFVRAAAAAYALDAQRIVAVGLSNGANITASMLFRHPALLRGAALLRPMLPYEPEPPPQFGVCDVLIAAGSEDPFSSVAQVERLAELLSGGGAAVTLAVEPRGGHQLTGHDLDRAGSWIAALTSSASA